MGQSTSTVFPNGYDRLTFSNSNFRKTEIYSDKDRKDKQYKISTPKTWSWFRFKFRWDYETTFLKWDGRRGDFIPFATWTRTNVKPKDLLSIRKKGLNVVEWEKIRMGKTGEDMRVESFFKESRLINTGWL